MEHPNINISSNHFDANAGNSFKELFADDEFTDVTLVCNDNQQLKAHKVILSSASPIFKNIFKTNNHSNPIIYMRGVNFHEMESIVKFIYLGQALLMTFLISPEI